MKAEEANLINNQNIGIISWIKEHASDAPSNITITNTTQATIIGANEEEIGSLKVSPGTTVKITQFTPDVLKVKLGELQLKIPTACSDFIAKANAQYELFQRRKVLTENENKVPEQIDKTADNIPILPKQPKIAWLGVSLAPVSEKYTKIIQLPNDIQAGEGAVITGIFVDSPAIRASLEVGQVITGYNGKPVKSVEDLRSMIHDSGIGTRAYLDVWHPMMGRSSRTIVLDEAPAVQSTPPTSPKKAWLGASLAQVSELMADKIKLPANLTTMKNGVHEFGALIINISQDSPAEHAHLEPGTVITEFNDICFGGPSELIKLISASEVGSIVRLKIWVPDQGWIEKSVTIGVPPEPTKRKIEVGTNQNINNINSINEADFSTPELIASAFAKNPLASANYLTTREIKVLGRVVKFVMQDPDKFIIGLEMTTGLRPKVIFTDDVKKLFGLISKDIREDNSNSFYNNTPEHINNTWLINGSELVLHSEWNVPSQDWQRNPYLYQNYPRGYVPKILKQKDSPVIGIGEERNFTVRFLKNTPQTVYFEIVK
jgi:S1-C subfamily serine protease